MNEFVRQGQEQLRCGFTTGTAAAIATKACGEILFTQKLIFQTGVMTPKGIYVETAIISAEYTEKTAKCSVVKDGGDDIDVTHGAEISVTLSLIEESGIYISGGVGVGLVTKRGLDQDVGNHAINSVPRKQITQVLEEIQEKYHYKGGFSVQISVPRGEELAKKTLNEKLGIVGGISILGTSGIVQPRSLEALLSSIEVEIKMHRAQGRKKIIITPGNYGMDFLEQNPWVKTQEVVQISNFLGDSLDLLAVHGFEEVLLVGHIGKLCKVAGGIMQTHSKYADGRREIFTAYTSLAGGSLPLLEKIMDSVSTDGCLELLIAENLHDKVLQKISDSAQKHIEQRVKGGYSIGFVMFSHKHHCVAYSEQGKKIIESWNEKK